MRGIFVGLSIPLSILGLLFVAVSLVIVTLPDVNQMRGCFKTTMYGVQLCPSSENYVKIGDVSSSLIDAVVVSEDAAFYHHKGFDWHEIKESFSRNLAAKGFQRGGSTISQQLAKNAFLSQERSLMRKAREAILTYQIESTFSKKEILEKYLNVVEFGPGIFGVKAAAGYYFQKRPADLNALESAFLAFLLPNPKGYHRSFADKRLTPFARNMISIIMRRLVAFGRIPQQTATELLSRLDEFPWAGLVETPIAPQGTAITLSPEEMHKILDEELSPPDAPSAGEINPEADPFSDGN